MQHPLSIKERNRIVSQNLGLVHHVVNRCKVYASERYGVDAEDLFSTGCIGLIKAANKFNPDTGNKFSTFAIPWIRGEIQHYLRDCCFVAGVKVSRKLKVNVYAVSFDAPLAEGTDFDYSTFIDVFPDSKNNWVTEQIDLRLALEQLKPEYRQALDLVYLQDFGRGESARKLGIGGMTLHRHIEVGLEQLRAILVEPVPLVVQGKKTRGWTEQEIKLLESCIETDLTLKSIIDNYREAARQQGFRNRTPSAVDLKIRRMKQEVAA